jgi:hypothetical protein
MRRQTWVGVVTLVAVGLVARVAAAEPDPAPSSSDRAPVAKDPDESDRITLARSAFQEGIDLAHRGRWAEALAAFERSSRLRPHAVTTYNIGFCELSLGMYTSAWRALAVALLEQDPAGTPALPEALRGSAEAYAAEAEQSLVRVALTTDPPNGAVTVDSRPLEPITLGGSVMALAGTREPGAPEPVPGDVVVVLDPGLHTFTVTAPGRAEETLSRTFTPGQRAALSLRAPPALVAAPPNFTPAKGPSRTAAYVAFGVGGAGLIAGAIFGGIAVAKANQLKSQCPDHGCPAGTPTNNLDSASGFATTATISLGVGAAGAAAGVLLWVLGTPPHRVGMAPVLGVRYAGVSARF